MATDKPEGQEPPRSRAPAWTRERVGASASALSALSGLGSLSVALSMAPWFVWSEDALSDLGHPRYSTWLVFGAGLLLSGALYLVFVWGLGRVVPRSPAGTAGLLFLGAGGASLSAVGVINESYGAPHFIVSLAYFTFVPLGMVLVAISRRASDPRWALATAALAFAAAAFGLSILSAIAYEVPFTSQAVPELIASALLALWSLSTAWLLWTGRLTPQRHPSA